MSGKRQTMVLIGVALLFISALLFYVAITQPKVYSEKEEVSYQTTGLTYSQTEPALPSQNAPAPSKEKAVQNTSETVYNYPININTATLDELMSIDGLGEVRASAIIEYRNYLGGYKSVSQIKNIKGIDEKIYEKIAGYLTV